MWNIKGYSFRELLVGELFLLSEHMRTIWRLFTRILWKFIQWDHMWACECCSKVIRWSVRFLLLENTGQLEVKEMCWWTIVLRKEQYACWYLSLNKKIFLTMGFQDMYQRRESQKFRSCAEIPIVLSFGNFKYATQL